MAISLVSAPDEFALTQGGRMVCRFIGDNQVLSTGAFASYRIDFGNPIPDGTTVVFSWNGQERKLVARTNPVSVNEFPAGPYDAAHITALLDFFGNYYWLRQDFALTPRLADGFFTDQVVIVARKPGAAYNLTIRTTGPDGLYSVAVTSSLIVGGGSAQIRERYSVLVELARLRPDFPANTDPDTATDGDFLPVYTGYLETDSNSSAEFDAGHILHSALTADLPAWTGNAHQVATRSLTWYRIGWAEAYGTPPDIGPMQFTAPMLALLGGNAYRQRAGGGTPLLSLIADVNAPGPAQDRALRTGSLTRTVRPAETQFLTFLNHCQLREAVTLHVRCIFDDNSEATVTTLATTQASWPVGQKITFPCGPAQLDIAGITPAGRTLREYSVKLITGDDTTLSKSYRYLLNYQHDPYVRQFVYLNSFGAIDTLTTYGKGSVELQRFYEQAERFLPTIYDVADGQYVEYDISLQEQTEVVTGFCAQTELRRWTDFYRSPVRFLLRGTTALPIGVTSKSIKQAKDGDSLLAHRFEFVNLFRDVFYADTDDEQAEVIPPGFVPAGNVTVEQPVIFPAFDPSVPEAARLFTTVDLLSLRELSALGNFNNKGFLKQQTTDALYRGRDEAIPVDVLPLASANSPGITAIVTPAEIDISSPDTTQWTGNAPTDTPTDETVRTYLNRLNDLFFTHIETRIATENAKINRQLAADGQYSFSRSFHQIASLRGFQGTTFAYTLNSVNFPAPYASTPAINISTMLGSSMAWMKTGDVLYARDAVSLQGWGYVRVTVLSATTIRFMNLDYAGNNQPFLNAQSVLLIPAANVAASIYQLFTVPFRAEPPPDGTLFGLTNPAPFTNGAVSVRLMGGSEKPGDSVTVSALLMNTGRFQVDYQRFRTPGTTTSQGSYEVALFCLKYTNGDVGVFLRFFGVGPSIARVDWQTAGTIIVPEFGPAQPRGLLKLPDGELIWNSAETDATKPGYVRPLLDYRHGALRVDDIALSDVPVATTILGGLQRNPANENKVEQFSLMEQAKALAPFIAKLLNLTPAPVNQAPIAPVFVNQNTFVGANFIYTAPLFTDPEGQPLTYQFSGMPPGTTAVATATNLVFSGQPTTIGVYQPSITAVDPHDLPKTVGFTIQVGVLIVPPTTPPGGEGVADDDLIVDSYEEGGPTPPPAKTIVSIAVNGPATVAEPGTGQYAALGTYSDNTTGDVSNLVNWSISPAQTGAAIHPQTGLLTVGSDNVTGNSRFTDVVATLIANSQLSGRKPITLIDGTVPPPAINLEACKLVVDAGGVKGYARATPNAALAPVQYNITGPGINTDWRGQEGWDSTIDGNTYNTRRIFPETLAEPGLYILSVRLEAQPGTVVTDTFTRAVAVTLASVFVTGPSAISEGSTGQYVATGTYSDGSTRDLTSQVVWSLGAVDTGAIIGASGLVTVATNTIRDDTRDLAVIATFGSVANASTTGYASHEKVITLIDTTPVPPVTLDSVTVFGPATIAEGSTEAYTATAYYSDGTSRNVTTEAAWSVTGTDVSIGTPGTTGPAYAPGVLGAAPNATVNDSRNVTVNAAFGGKTGFQVVRVLDATTGGTCTNGMTSAVVSPQTTFNVEPLTAFEVGLTVYGNPDDGVLRPVDAITWSTPGAVRVSETIDADRGRARITLRYAEYGTYTVTATVTDACGVVHIATGSVTFNNL